MSFGVSECGHISPVLNRPWLTFCSSHQVWLTPSSNKEVSPMHLHRTYGQSHSDVTAFDWSPDGQWIAAGSKDLTVRVFSLDPIPGYVVPTLSGHREPTVGVFFTGLTGGARAIGAGEEAQLMTVSRDGALFEWGFERPAGEPPGDQAEAGTSGQDQPRFSGGQWRLLNKHFFMQPAAKCSAADYHP